MSTTPDHYEVLGVRRDASTEDIERARKNMARFWHPDRNKQEDAAHHFDAVQKAAEVLRDPRQRAEYDRDFALRAAMSIPRDRRPQDSPDETFRVPNAQAGTGYPGGPGAAYTPRSYEGPGQREPGYYEPSQAGPEGGRAGRRGRERGRRRSRRAAVSIGLAVVAIVAIWVATFTIDQGGGTSPAARGNTGQGGKVKPGGSGSSGGGTGTGGSGTVTLPEYSASQDDYPVGGGQVLSIGGPVLALLGASGQPVWHENAQVSALDGDTAVSGGPQSHSCAVASGDNGHQYDFVSLAAGQQTVVPASSPATGGSFAWGSDRVALPDGTIRNPCTGSVVGRAAPSGTFTTAECLIGSTVIGSGQGGQMAWQNGHKLWQIKTSSPVICDNRGTVVMLNSTGTQISYLDLVNGKTRWTVKDPTCSDGCLTHAGVVRLLGTPQTVILTDTDEVLALARSNGRVLWQKTGECALVARATPIPSVLLGSCSSQGAQSSAATVVSPSSGAAIGSYPVSVNGCNEGSRWTANTHLLLVACPDMSTATPKEQASLIPW